MNIMIFHCILRAVTLTSKTAKTQISKFLIQKIKQNPKKWVQNHLKTSMKAPQKHNHLHSVSTSKIGRPKFPSNLYSKKGKKPLNSQHFK